MTNIWTPNGNRVASLAPGPGDTFVVTTIQGQRVAVQPIADYEKALTTAEAFAGQTKHPIKVLCMSLRELLTFMGMTPAEFGAGMSPKAEVEFRQLAAAACRDALRDCNEPSVRADAYDLLVNLGIIKPW
jgi:hypothetical protein